MKRPAIALLLMILPFVCACGQPGDDGSKRKSLPQNRLQDPRKPYPYKTEEVRYKNRVEEATLEGTLSTPKSGGPFPAVLLLSGSGFQDRDETIFGHKPFKVLADYFTRRGIAVLRVDDRSVGGSTGDILHATPETFAVDALAGVRFLAVRDDIEATAIGLIGHSEGALVAAVAASHSSEIAFVVMLAGLGLPWCDNSLLVQADGLRRQGKNEEVIAAARNLNKRIFAVVREGHDRRLTEMKLRLTIADWRTSLEGETKEEVDRFTSKNPDHWDRLAAQFAEPPYQYYMTTDPRFFIERIKCPVLALCGEKDVQVMAEANLAAIETTLVNGGNTDCLVQKLKGLNHLFQHCETGLTREYADIEETFSPEAMELIATWIMGRVD